MSIAAVILLGLFTIAAVIGLYGLFTGKCEKRP